MDSNQDSDDSIYNNFDNYVGSESYDDDVDLLDECNSMKQLNINEIRNDKENSGASQDRIDWYKNGIDVMKKSVETLGKERSEVSKQFNEIKNNWGSQKVGEYNMKRELSLTDESKECIVLTLWGEQYNKFDDERNCVLVHNAVVVEFNGTKTVNCAKNTFVY